MNRRVAVVIAAAAGVALVASAVGIGIRSYVDEEARLTPPVAEPTPPPFDGEVKLAEFVAEYGALPPRVPYSEAEREATRQMEIEILRQNTLSRHPAAVLPDAAFAAYDDAARRTCLSDAGIATDYDYGFPVLEDQADAIAGYSCAVTFPPEPHVRPTDQQLRYAYAYWTTFVIPCYEAFGFPQPRAISEGEFVARFPMQVWHPDYPENTGENTVVNATCLSLPPGA